MYLVVDLDIDRYHRVLELNRRYVDLRLGFVDAAVAALTEQLGVRRLATTDPTGLPGTRRSLAD